MNTYIPDYPEGNNQSNTLNLVPEQFTHMVYMKAHDQFISEYCSFFHE